MVRPAIATLVLALALPTHSSGVVPQENAAAALKVLEKTKSTRATYSVFFWNRVDPGNRPAFEEWSAEFHMGALHRVETPRDRLIADCSNRGSRRRESRLRHQHEQANDFSRTARRG
jgi:hypothetical protein